MTEAPIEARKLLLSAPEIAAEIGIAKRTLMRWVKAGKFPKPIRLTRQLMRWRSADVHAWIELLRPASLP